MLNLYLSKRKEKDFFPFDKVTAIADKISDAINNGEPDNAEQSKGQERILLKENEVYNDWT